MSSDSTFSSHDLPIEYVRTADGTSLAVRSVAGKGPLIVALHGFTGDGTTMQPLVEACREGRPALLIDLIGHGASDAPEFVEPYSMASVVDQVLSVIGPRDIGTVHLIGYSMGGRVALSIAARAPWYFASVTSISATPGIHDAPARAERHDADLARADHLEAIGIDGFVDEWLALDLFGPYVALLDESARTATIEQRRRSSPVGLANSLRGTGTGAMPPVWLSMPALRSPLLAIAGSLDEPYIDIARRMAQAAPFAELHIVEGAGHVAHVENCFDVGARVAEFLRVCENNADFPGRGNND